MFGSDQWMYSSGGFYPKTINGSLRFNDDDSAYLSRTPSSAGSLTTWTISLWVKRSSLSSSQMLWSRSASYLNFQANDTLKWREASGDFEVVSQRVFRDTSAWYHIVAVWNTTAGSAVDRYAVYVNGEQISFTHASPSNASDDPTASQNSGWNSAAEHRIGSYTAVGGFEFDGYMAEVFFIDGTAHDADDFGETKNGVWVPKNVGTADFDFDSNNSFYLKFGGNVEDSSSNSNDWTANNIASDDYVNDSPTDNFCTLNIVLPDSHFNTSELSNGNLFYNEGEGNNGSGRPTGTFSVTSGKWYWEVEVPSQQNHRAIGFTRTDNIGKGNVTLHGSGFTAANSVVGIDLSDDTIDQVDNSGTHTQHASGLTGMSNNDIFGISVDLDGGTFQMYRNGSTYGSSYSLSDLSDWQTYGMTPTASASTYQAFRFNFGQGGFTHTPPSGYKALSTANLPNPEIDPAQDKEPRDYFETFLYTGNGEGLQVGDVIKKPADTIDISNSLIFPRGPYLSRTFGSSTDESKWTWSAWVKRAANIGNTQTLFNEYNANSDGNYGIIYFGANNQLYFTGWSTVYFRTDRTFEDTSRWHHIVVAVNTDDGTPADRIKVYVDGLEVTDFAQTSNPASGATIGINKSSQTHYIGTDASNSSGDYDGYMAEVHFVDGEIYDQDDFGNFDANGIWIPKTVTAVTDYGTNGFHLDFSDNTSTTTLGEDQSGEGNDWTVTNFDTTDQVSDSPTDNHMVLSPTYQRGTNTFSEGNLKAVIASVSNNSIVSHILPRTGKHYFEFELDQTQGSAVTAGLVDATIASGSLTHYSGTGHFGYYASNGQMYVNGTLESYGASYAAGDIIGVAIDFDAKTVQFYKNNTGQGVFDYGSRFPDVENWKVMASNATNTGTQTFIFDFGQKGFTYTEPTGYTAISEDNITVDDQNLESPDFVWIKNREQGDSHQLYDSVRGVQKVLISDDTDAEDDAPNGLLDFNANGFTIGSQNEVNTSGEDYVAWCWKANGATGVSNTDGSITSTVSANTESGFSIVSYTGNKTNGATVGHGLSSAPEFIIIKNRDRAEHWPVYHASNTSAPETEIVYLNLTNATSDNDSFWNDTAPTSSVFTLGLNDRLNANDEDHIAYCFHSVESFSKFGSYTGNDSPDGNFIYTGFSPALIAIKYVSGSAGGTKNWYVWDNARSPQNVNDNILYWNTSGSEGGDSAFDIDMLSNGFKLRNSEGGVNNAAQYIYMAFAENPFKYSNAR